MPLVFKIQDPLYTIMNVRNSSVLKVRASWKRFNHPLQSVPTSFKAGPLYEVGGAAVGAVGRSACAPPVATATLAATSLPRRKGGRESPFGF